MVYHSGRTKVVNNIVMDISLDYIRQMSETNTFQLNSLQPETLVIADVS